MSCALEEDMLWDPSNMCLPRDMLVHRADRDRLDHDLEHLNPSQNCHG